MGLWCLAMERFVQELNNILQDQSDGGPMSKFIISSMWLIYIYEKKKKVHQNKIIIKLNEEKWIIKLKLGKRKVTLLSVRHIIYSSDLYQLGSHTCRTSTLTLG